MGIDGGWVYADEDNELYEIINLNKSFRSTFLDPSTPFVILNRIKSGGMGDLLEVLSQWNRKDLVIIPPKPDQAFNQGGCFIFDAAGVLKLAHCDRGTGDHVELGKVLEVVEGVIEEG